MHNLPYRTDITLDIETKNTVRNVVKWFEDRGYHFQRFRDEDLVYDYTYDKEGNVVVNIDQNCNRNNRRELGKDGFGKKLFQNNYVTNDDCNKLQNENKKVVKEMPLQKKQPSKRQQTRSKKRKRNEEDDEEEEEGNNSEEGGNGDDNDGGAETNFTEKRKAAESQRGFVATAKKSSPANLANNGAVQEDEGGNKREGKNNSFKTASENIIRQKFSNQDRTIDKEINYNLHDAKTSEEEMNVVDPLDDSNEVVIIDDGTDGNKNNVDHHRRESHHRDIFEKQGTFFFTIL
jgi:hypothetical protein